MAKKIKIPNEHEQLYDSMKSVFEEMWCIKLKEICGIGSIRNFSDDNPLSILKVSDIQELLLPEMSFFGDENAAHEKIALFIESERASIDICCSIYASMQNKSVDSLSLKEVKYCLAFVIEDYLYRRLEERMNEQNLAEIAKIVKENATAEDFNESVAENYDKIDFGRKWNHTRTKSGAMLSLDELTAAGVEIEGDYADMLSSGDDNKMLEAFLKSLDDRSDRDLVEYLLRGYTQEQIAKSLGLASQSAVSKRIKKLHEKFEEFKEKYI